MMGGRGTSPKACMQMTWKACPAGRRGTGTVHIATASAHELQYLSALTCLALCSPEAAFALRPLCVAHTHYKLILGKRPILNVKLLLVQHLSTVTVFGILQAMENLAVGRAAHIAGPAQGRCPAGQMPEGWQRRPRWETPGMP